MPDRISKGCYISMVRIDLLVMLAMTADLCAMTARTHVMTMGLNTDVSKRASSSPWTNCDAATALSQGLLLRVFGAHLFCIFPTHPVTMYLSLFHHGRPCFIFCFHGLLRFDVVLTHKMLSHCLAD
jgi:hypothetical protein